jgi:2-methylcitrate dehydratase PrpD
MAALAAQEGFTADLALLDKPFHSVYGLKIDGVRLLANLVRCAAVLEVGFKPWCAARQTMAATQGFKELLAQGLDPSAIEAIKVAVPPAYLGMVNHGVIPGDRGSHLTSLPYQLVLAALAPEMMSRLEHAPAPTPQEQQAMLAKISVEADAKLMEHFPRSWPARIEVRARAGGGQRLVTEIPGDPGRPFDESQIRDKYRRVFSPLLAAPGVVSLCDAALGVLDRPEGVKGLLQQIEGCYPR